MKDGPEHHSANAGRASHKYSGRPETFQHDPTGTFTYSSFPQGWFDAAQVSPNSTAPQPSAVVIKTTDAFDHSTKALATLPDNMGVSILLRQHVRIPVRITPGIGRPVLGSARGSRFSGASAVTEFWSEPRSMWDLFGVCPGS